MLGFLILTPATIVVVFKRASKSPIWLLVMISSYNLLFTFVSAVITSDFLFSIQEIYFNSLVSFIRNAPLFDLFKMSIIAFVSVPLYNLTLYLIWLFCLYSVI